MKLLALYYFLVMAFRALYFSALRKYRLEGGNYKRVILIGSIGLKPLANFMMNYSNFGYKILCFFSDDKQPELTYDITNRALRNNGNGVIPHLGTVDQSKQFALDNHVEEIYCSLSEFSHETLQDFLDFGDKHFIVVKLVPDNQGVLSRNMYQEYYGMVPVLSLRKLPFDKPMVKYGKRLFDIIFSLAVIIFVLSWLTPLLYILIKKESKGPLFFKQIRDGLQGNTFICYKFRSMALNDRSEKDQTVKGDPRITKVGKFIRKTSIDELPQFFNVLKGEMSVVGPRPHMLSQSDRFKKIVDNYMVRHYVKPGITGLAQVKGFRGEIESDEDIINRVRLDIFYIENWSFILDLNIIIRTILNIFSGEEKAY
jgi:putative colanic acid biosynthesis UDP-glucose lipid carrier transferase